ncbi:MAG: polysaccharide biosynthesis/export family protein [Bryobacteraceae bacterium]|nr:polysaccharide biosynthesis/export family protein [Bryobacteraceae bacterium]
MTKYLLFLGLLAGALSAADTPSQFSSRTPRYRLQTSDVVEIQFKFTPEFTQTVTLQPDGFVPLQMVGELKLQDLTLEEARAAIAAKYAGVLHEPAITLTLKEFNKPYVIVGGEVTKPGKLDLRGDLTLTDAVSMAGGFTQNAKQDQVLLFRRINPEMMEVKRVNVRDILGKGHLNEDIRLLPGDAVYAGKSNMAKFDRFMAVSRLGFFFPLSFR